jgi:hypothetical protein
MSQVEKGGIIQEGGGDIYGNYRDFFNCKIFDGDIVQGGEIGNDIFKNMMGTQINSLSENSKNILFLRHGISESNELSSINEPLHGWTHPFLTNFGRLQAYSYGKGELPEVIKNGNYNNVEFYSSTLPRACETIQLISQGLMDSDSTIPLDKTITRINGISEIPIKGLKSSQRSISKDELFYVTQYLNLVNKGLKFNNIVENSPEGVKANEQNLVDEYNLSGKGLIRKQYMTTNETYKQFVENIHKIFRGDENTLHIVVVHGKFMMEKMATGSILYNHDPLKHDIKMTPEQNAKLSEEIALLMGDQSQAGGGIFTSFKQSIEERKVNKKLRKDKESRISDEALRYLLGVYSLKDLIENEDGIKNLFKIIQYMNKEGKEITKLIKPEIYGDKSEIVEGKIKQFEELVSDIDKRFKKLYITNEIDPNNAEMHKKIDEDDKINAFRLKPPNLCGVFMKLYDTDKIKDMNIELDRMFNEDTETPDFGGKTPDLLKFFKENQKYYEESFLNPKSRNYWNLYLLFFCKKATFHVPSVKALHHNVSDTRDQDFLKENESLDSFVETIGKKDALGQMKHNTKDLINAIEDYFRKKQQTLEQGDRTDLKPQRKKTPHEIYTERQNLHDTLTKRDKEVQNNGYGDYRANIRRLRNTASKKIKSGFSSLKNSLSNRFGRNQGGGRRRRKTYRKNKIHYKKRKSKKKKNKYTKKTRRP